jgi:prepilin signal peptidase PulO-like enzyme (type II secretory pathway)
VSELFVSQPFLANTLVILGVMIATSLYDLKYREVPDVAWGSLLVWAVVAVAKGWSGVSWLGLGLGLVVGTVAGFGLWWLGRRFYEGDPEDTTTTGESTDEAKEGFGMGDAKLMGALGAALGLNVIPMAILWMLAGGFIVALITKIRGASDFAYVPALTIGIVCYMLFSGKPVSWLPG